jgi:guanine deaminase
MNQFMKLAKNEAEKNLKMNSGGPFGAVIVKGGKVIAKARNMVLETNDPTAHAEINVIRIASKKLKRFNLSDCVLYSSCKPCPMCLSAIYWARIKKVYFGCTSKDAEKIGFDDNVIYNFLNGKFKEKKFELIKLDTMNCLDVFKKWEKKEDKKLY